MKVDLYETFRRDYDGTRIRQQVGTATVENGMVVRITQDRAGYIPARLLDKNGKAVSLESAMLFTSFQKKLKKGLLKIERKAPRGEVL